MFYINLQVWSVHLLDDFSFLYLTNPLAHTSVLYLLRLFVWLYLILFSWPLLPCPALWLGFSRKDVSNPDVWLRISWTACEFRDVFVADLPLASGSATHTSSSVSIWLYYGRFAGWRPFKRTLLMAHHCITLPLTFRGLLYKSDIMEEIQKYKKKLLLVEPK